MRDRPALRPLIGMGVIAVVSAGVGTLLNWLSAEMQARLFESYTQQDGTLTDEVYREWDRVSVIAYTLQTMTMPLFLVALLAVFAILAVLARRA